MANANIIHLDSNNFKQEVENSTIPVLVDFWATWCSPCRAIAPILEQLADRYEGKVKIGKVDVDNVQDLAASFRIMSIPTLILFKDGKAYEQLVGLRSIEELDMMLKNSI